MFAKKAIALKAGLLTAGAMLAMLALGPYASANTIRINFSANAGSGYADLTVVSDPDASSQYKPGLTDTEKLSQWDPEGAQHITDASGSFNGHEITGVKALSAGTPPQVQSNPPKFETLPKSYSTIDLSNSSYDNLFYVNGSPLVCPPVGANGVGYPYFGGFLDVYGVIFTLDNSNLVGLWSDGVVPPDYAGTPGGLTYGLSVLTPTDGGYLVSTSQFAGAMASVPEPEFMWLFGAVLLGLFAWRRSTESRE